MALFKLALVLISLQLILGTPLEFTREPYLLSLCVLYFVGMKNISKIENRKWIVRGVRFLGLFLKKMSNTPHEPSLASSFLCISRIRGAFLLYKTLGHFLASQRNILGLLLDMQFSLVISQRCQMCPKV